MSEPGSVPATMKSRCDDAFPWPGPFRLRAAGGNRPHRRKGVLLLLAVLLALLCTTALAQAPRIGVVTMAPGEDYWARFGHNAILVDDPAAGTRILYNYGYFDFEQPGFLTRFLRGRMLYELAALPMEQDLRGYEIDGRGVILQWLDFTPAQAFALRDFLVWNALPANKDYRYDYFLQNCSTKVRDALNEALGGTLKRQWQGRSHGFTYRSEALRLSSTLPWLYLGIHLGLGPFVDRPMTWWDEGYVPGRLADALREARTADGRPLVVQELQLLPQRIATPPSSPPDWRWRFVFAGLALALLFGFALHPRAPRAARVTGAAAIGVLWLAFGLVGVGLLALWIATDHSAAWQNENALLFNPLCLLQLGAVPALARGDAPGRWLARVALAVAACACFAFFLKFLPFRIQSTGDWIALLLPLHLVLALRLRPVRSA